MRCLARESTDARASSFQTEMIQIPLQRDEDEDLCKFATLSFSAMSFKEVSLIL